MLTPDGMKGTFALLTVLSGTLSWGDGDNVDTAKEQKFGPGTVLLATGDHWAAARDGEVVAQIVRIAPGNKLSEAVDAQRTK